ncbi:MAG: aconitase X catalytic domain-containing protein [Chloroflexi bacterium]|nr:aconitase X catalytic domain-containing protein [Chloroflexota bacterium]
MEVDLTPELRLTESDRAMLDGQRGPADQMAMRIITRMAAVVGAERLMDITGAHIDSSLYLGEATLEFAEMLADRGAQVKVPTTLNVSGVDEAGWQEWEVPANWAEKARKQMMAYEGMGCTPTWTCAPYQLESRPKFGQQVAWGESNAIIFANSVLGARTERYPDLLDICAAITGRVPAVGLHLTKNRAAQVLLQMQEIPVELQEHDSFYPVLGYVLGKIAGDRVACISGFAVEPDEDQLKAFGAAAASSGAVALFHIPGVTPEAPSVEAAFQGREPEERIPISMDHLRAARKELTTAPGTELDMVVLGSPHFSLAEFQSLTPLLEGVSKHPKVQFLITTSRAMAALAEKSGLLDPIREFGGRITLDTCILTTPMLSDHVRSLMTNSAKYAYYSPGLLNVNVAYGGLAECVRSAVHGKIMQEDGIWQN